MRIIGIDLGIASIGWAVLDIEPDAGRIAAAGTWMFDAPETDKERTPTNTIRRRMRGQRRVIRRRRLRMNAIRRLLAEHGLLPAPDRTALALRLDPWTLRAEALERRLTPPELAGILGHIAKHRGFRSNAKPTATDAANAPDETSKMKAAIEATRERLAQWPTVGAMFARDPAFADRKRNRGGGFTRSILRRDQENEIGEIFRVQRRLLMPHAADALESAFRDIAFTQRPLQDSHHLVGFCPFVPAARRAARRSYAFELFRALSRLANLRITLRGAPDRRLTADEIARVTADFGAQKKLSYAWLRKRLDLDDNARFADVAREDEKNDFVARAGNAAEGTATLRAAIPDSAWRALLATPAVLDDIAAILSFRSDLGSIREGLNTLPIDPLLAATLADAAEHGKFAKFTGAGHISAAAARALHPHLARGLVYSEACAEAGFDHAARPATDLAEIRNPVVRKAVSELCKQMKAITQEYGPADRIHLELARDLGKSADERDEIRRGIEKRNRARDTAAEHFAERVGRPPNGAEEMLRYELWHEQAGRCLYTDELISPTALVAGDNSIQVDHILPWSRFGDDSFVNKTLCRAGANAEKRGRTPYEWFTDQKTPQQWEEFERRVEGCKSMKGRKKRGFYLRRNAAEVQEAFRNRNLTDTRYACRLAMDLIKRLNPTIPAHHIAARPGALTAKLRRGWGLEGFKKNPDGTRKPDDRHHALDAIVVAACSEPMLQRLTRAFQESERLGRARDFAALDAPWPGFRLDAEAAMQSVFVARAERHRARGEAHAATIRQVRERDGKMVVYERKAVEALAVKDLSRVKDADRNAAIIESVRLWIEEGKPKDRPPRSHKGDVIRKVRLETTDKPAIAIRHGTVDRGDMARVDVFSKADAKGKCRYYVVPIYPHQIATQEAPPDRAVDANKPEAEWTRIDAGFVFRFSIYGHSYIEVIKPDGEVIAGYFKGLDRSVGAIALADHENALAIRRGIGARTLAAIARYQVDRLGRKFPVQADTRTWRGAACT